MRGDLRNGRGGFVSLDCYAPGSFDTAFLENYAGSKDKTTVGNKEAVVYRNLAENDSSLTILTWNDMAQNAPVCARRECFAGRVGAGGGEYPI